MEIYMYLSNHRTDRPKGKANVVFTEFLAKCVKYDARYKNRSIPSTTPPQQKEIGESNAFFSIL
jgi:hypothetical protein